MRAAVVRRGNRQTGCRLDQLDLFRFGVRLRPVNRSGSVLRRRVDREELHRLVVRVDHVVLRARGHAHDAALVDLLAAAFEHRLALALDDVDQLVDLVHLGADLLTGLEAHEHELAVFAGEQHLAKPLVVLGLFLELCDVRMDHRDLLSGSRGSLPERRVAAEQARAVAARDVPIEAAADRPWQGEQAAGARHRAVGERP
jgi:hypothetical protein